MAEKSIGELSAKISAKATGFNAGIDGAIKKAEAFHGHIGRMLAAPLAGVSSIAGAPGKAISAFTQPIQGALSNIPIIGTSFAAIPASAGGFMEFIKKGEDQILAQARAADKLGMSMHATAAFDVMAGSRTEDMQHALSKLQLTLGEASNGSKEFEAKLKRLGMTSSDVAGLPLEQQYKKVASAIAAIKDPTERAVAAHGMFNKSYEGIADIVNRGGAAFDKAAGQVDKFHLAASRADVEKIKQVKEELAGLDRQMAGMQMQLAAKTAPFKVAAMAGFMQYLDSGGPIWSEKFADKAAARFYRPPGELPKWTAAEVNAMNPNAIGQPWQPPALRAPVPTTEQKKVYDELNATLQRQAETYAMTARQAEIFKIQQDGMPAAFLQTAKAIASQLDVLDRITAGAARGSNALEQYNTKVGELKMAVLMGAVDMKAYNAEMLKLGAQKNLGKGAEAAQIFNQTRTPFEAFDSKMKQLKNLFPGGGEVFDRAVGDAWKKVTGGDKPGAVTAPRVEAGSGEALEMMARLNDTSKARGPDEIKAVLEAMRAADAAKAVQAHADALAIAEAVKDNVIAVAPLN